jgi:hypothetical protein
MTKNEFYTCVGYLANPARYAWIEAEMPGNAFSKFSSDYSKWTSGFPLPTDTSHKPLYVWPPETNKWGKEMRIYFYASDSTKTPPALLSLLEPTKMSRHGYERYNCRISTNNDVIQFLQNGFLLGLQDLDRIKSQVPEDFLTDFNAGFDS